MTEIKVTSLKKRLQEFSEVIFKNKNTYRFYCFRLRKWKLRSDSQIPTTPFI